MKFSKFSHECDDKGKVPGGGAVRVDGGVLISNGEGCGLPNCNCSPPYFISVCLPRKDGKVESILVELTETEMKRLLENSMISR